MVLFVETVVVMVEKVVSAVHKIVEVVLLPPPHHRHLLPVAVTTHAIMVKQTVPALMTVVEAASCLPLLLLLPRAETEPAVEAKPAQPVHRIAMPVQLLLRFLPWSPNPRSH
jgi:hypothetical protein